MMNDIEEELDAGMLRALSHYGKSELVAKVHIMSVCVYFLGVCVMILSYRQGCPLLYMLSTMGIILAITAHVVTIKKIWRT